MILIVLFGCDCDLVVGRVVEGVFSLYAATNKSFTTSEKTRSLTTPGPFLGIISRKQYEVKEHQVILDF